MGRTCGRGSAGGRQRKNQLKRNRAVWEIQNHIEERTELSPEDNHTYLQEIFKGNLAFFGIVKLSKVILDDLHDVGSWYARRLTFLEFAIGRKKWRVVAAFLRAGANPRVYDGYVRNEEFQVGEAVRTLPMNYALFTLNAIWEMREEVNVNDHRSWKPCGHRVSEESIWDMFLKEDCKGGSRRLRCPVCGNGYKEDANDVTIDEGRISRGTCKAKVESLRLFHLLPEHSESTRKSKEKVKPRPLRDCFGYNRSQLARTDDMFEAVKSGDCYKICALLDQGLDLEARNRSGQTPLIIATYYEHEDVVRLLLKWGVDIEAHCTAGCTALSIAKAKRMDNLLRIFENKSSNPLIDTQLSRSSFDYDKVVVTTVVPTTTDHPGAGTWAVNGFDSVTLNNLDTFVLEKKFLANAIPTRAKRVVFFDSEGWICDAVNDALQEVAKLGGPSTCFPQLQILKYDEVGGVLPPHVDLSKTWQGLRSTHTFLLHLRTCEDGGSTVLLDAISKPDSVFAEMKPKRGCLYLFPHQCPHMGTLVTEPVKIFLRGELG